ncbi:nuclease-related domain-containing protein [Variovorax sp. VNK109]|uniref:nuclease-related domain-containing protein n=1 Tax=Variovorax sp. VNK109 TaxID=3400919 RepID=UPI003BFBC942
MLIKTADDRTRRIGLLENLQGSPLLADWQKNKLKDELFALRMGVAGERDAAHYIDTYYRDGENHAVIHDLRLSMDGEVAQIDHLLISRGLNFYLLETKNFSGSITISDAGEFSVTYPNRRTYGIPSPIEQSRRHAVVLEKVLDQLGIQGRLGVPRQIRHVVLVDPKATIKRPSPKVLDTSMVIKADQFRSWHTEWVEKEAGVAELFGSMINLRSSSTLREMAEKIARQHRPVDPLSLPAYLKPKTAPPSSAPPVPAPPDVARASPIETRTPPSVVEGEKKKRLVCEKCGEKISRAEGLFCWSKPQRFGGVQYCRTHQSDFQ